MITTEYSRITRKEFFTYKKQMEIIRTGERTNHNGWAYAWDYSGWIIDEVGRLYWVHLEKSNSAMHPGIRYTISSWNYIPHVLSERAMAFAIERGHR